MALVRPFGRVGIAQLFQVRVLDRPDPLRTAPVFAASRTLSPVKLLEEVARVRAPSVIVTLQAVQLGIAGPRTSADGSLVGIRHDLLQHVLAGRTTPSTSMLPQESSEEPALPFTEGAPRPSRDVLEPGTIHLAQQRGALLEAARAGDASQLLRILRGASCGVGTIKAGGSGATLLHLFASAAAAASTVTSTQQLSYARLGRTDAVSTAAAAATPTGCFPSTSTCSIVAAPSSLRHSAPAEAIAASSSVLIAAIEELVAAGVDIDTPAANGSTALHWAAGSGKIDMVHALLACGADPYARSFTWRWVALRMEGRERLDLQSSSISVSHAGARFMAAAADRRLCIGRRRVTTQLWCPYSRRLRPCFQRP